MRAEPAAFAALATASIVIVTMRLFGSYELQDDAPLPLLRPQLFGRPLSDETPVMVLLSGWPDDHSMWAPQVAEFGDHYHVVSMSTPDFDRNGLRRRWGYYVTEVPQMIAAGSEHYLLGPLPASLRLPLL